MKKTLVQGLPSVGCSLTEEQIDRLCLFGSMLLEKNQVMNLTAIREPERVATLHFLDSLAILQAADFKGRSVVDVGCGAGFPGVPICIAEPGVELTLLDSLGKRMNWLKDEVLPAIGARAEVVTARAEEYALQYREGYDIAVSRAVARLNILCELCMPLVKPGGVFLAMKGQIAAEELAEADNAIRILGGKVDRVLEYPVEDAKHCIIVIRKVSPTPAKYPRSFGKIKKQPL